MSGPAYDRAAFLEDVQWLAETGETWLGAAQRLGLTPAALERRLRTLGAQCLQQRLSGYHDWNTAGRSRRRDTAA